MTDWPLIALRWAGYADLGLLFGLPCLGLALLSRRERAGLPRLRLLLSGLAAAGLALTVAGFIDLGADMAGVAPSALDVDLARTLLLQTALGWATMARCLALALALLLALTVPVERLAQAVLAPAGVALASLAWAGHGNATGGTSGYIHLAADAIHLLGASAWLGGIVLLLILVSRPAGGRPATVRALAGFAPLGTAIVAVLLATGVVNLLYLVPPSDLPSLASSAYGRLLITKLILFLAMLGLAARHRFRMVPALARTLGQTGQEREARRLARSMTLELALALAVLALVAWFGRLEP